MAARSRSTTAMNSVISLRLVFCSFTPTSLDHGGGFKEQGGLANLPRVR